jgi:hypothetical protein
MTPKEFCDRINTTFSGAFPDREQWAISTDWSDCRTSTCAESAVVYAFRSRSGEPRTSPWTPEDGEPFSGQGHLSHVSEVADRINRGCQIHGITEPYDPRRVELHRTHGELVSKGITDPQEIVRVVAHRLQETSPRSTVSVTQGG